MVSPHYWLALGWWSLPLHELAQLICALSLNGSLQVYDLSAAMARSPNLDSHWEWLTLSRHDLSLFLARSVDIGSQVEWLALYRWALVICGSLVCGVLSAAMTALIPLGLSQ